MVGSSPVLFGMALQEDQTLFTPRYGEVYFCRDTSIKGGIGHSRTTIITVGSIDPSKISSYTRFDNEIHDPIESTTGGDRLRYHSHVR